MIIFRYLSREVLTTMSAITAVLLVIIMSGRFIRYLAQAAQGALDPSVLFLIMGYRLPGFLQLILPLGFFLGILLAYGRMYLDSEMSILFSSGFSMYRMLGYTMAPALLVALLVAWLSMGLSPQGVVQVEKIINQQDAMTEFDTLVPGRFQAMRGGNRVTYTEDLSGDRTRLSRVFITESRMDSKGASKSISILVAKNGEQQIQEDGSRYLILKNGYRYDGVPGHADYRVMKYDTYGVLLPKPEISSELNDKEGIPTSQLLRNDDLSSWVELQWRFSIPLLVFVVAVMAVPLAKVNPHQGRYLKLLPAILLYMLYLTILIICRGMLEKGKLPPELGLWWIHAIFLAIGLCMVFWESMQLALARRRMGK